MVKGANQGAVIAEETPAAAAPRTSPFRPRRILPAVLLGLLALAVGAGLFVFAVNTLMVRSARSFVVASAAAAPKAPLVIVPGATVYPDGTPSTQMVDRMDTAIRLYRQGSVRSLDLSGFPNEVAYMTAYARSAGIPAAAILADPAGPTTYHTMANAARVFHIEKALIATQRYHLPRSVYLARSLGIDAIGVPADLHAYPDDRADDTTREWGARVKAFLQISLGRIRI